VTRRRTSPRTSALGDSSSPADTPALSDFAELIATNTGVDVTVAGRARHGGDSWTPALSRRDVVPALALSRRRSLVLVATELVDGRSNLPVRSRLARSRASSMSGPSKFARATMARGAPAACRRARPGSPDGPGRRRSPRARRRPTHDNGRHRARRDDAHFSTAATWRCSPRAKTAPSTTSASSSSRQCTSRRRRRRRPIPVGD